MEIYLQLEDDRIQKSGFFTNGWGSSVTFGSVTAELVTGKEFDEVGLIGGDTVYNRWIGQTAASQREAYEKVNV